MEWTRGVEDASRVVVGVNKFQVEEGRPEIFRPSDESRAQVLKDLAELRRTRDAAAVESALRVVEETARGRTNLMPAILAAVEARATTGELCAKLERVFGRYRPPEVL
jgi:methylmalonyl-CoA mutase N-terminal domain/subunit